MLKIYNTLSRKIEEFKPIKKNKVGLYTCGPTVYNYAHLGNLRAYLVADLLKRFLKYKGFKVKQVMNVTDVDDKTIRESQKAGKTLKEFTDFYLKTFLEDLEDLNIEKPEIMPRATEHIKEMVALVKRLEKNGYTYRSNNSIYFKISKFKSYGHLSQLEKQDLKKGASGRVLKDEYSKEEVNDFVLWKAWQKEDGENFWETEIGKGRPGWHLECSTMSMKYLGEHFDVHTGGIDLIFPHHSNEIAQSEAATGKKFVNFWVHNEHLLVEGQRMGKSLGNFYALKDLKARNYHPLLLRVILLKTNYRQILNFIFNEFETARTIAEKFINFLINLDFVQNKKPNKLKIDFLINNCQNAFEKALDDDLNISQAFAVIFDFMNEINKLAERINVSQADKIKKFIFEIDKVFGFIENLFEEYKKVLKERIKSSAVKKLIKERQKARGKGDFQKADFLRKEIEKNGLLVEDTKEGYLLKTKNYL